MPAGLMFSGKILTMMKMWKLYSVPRERAVGRWEIPIRRFSNTKAGMKTKVKT